MHASTVDVGILQTDNLTDDQLAKGIAFFDALKAAMAMAAALPE